MTMSRSVNFRLMLIWIIGDDDDDDPSALHIPRRVEREREY